MTFEPAMSHDLKILEGLLSGLGLAFGLWLFYRVLQRSDSPARVVFKGLLTVALLAGDLFLIHRINGSLHEGTVTGNFTPVFLAVVSVAGVGVVLSILWAPHLGSFLISPLTDLFDGGHEPPVPRPAYSAALSQRKNNRPLAAVVAIREQLAKFPNDFKGVMLLADIQAEDLADGPGAILTLRRFCDTPGVPEPQVLAALKRLAGLYLDKDADVDAGLAIMEEIMARFPDAKISQRTAQRLGRVPGAPPGVSGKNAGRKYVSDFIAPRRD